MTHPITITDGALLLGRRRRARTRTCRPGSGCSTRRPPPGYGGLELGPYGYVPLDLDRVGGALDARGLYIVAGTIFDDLV